MFATVVSVLLLFGYANGAFVTNSHGVNSALQQKSPWTSSVRPVLGETLPTCDYRSSARNMMDESFVTAASNLWLSTIDQDIAKLSDNEFAPIFGGGIVVMFGGVLSAVVVGGILAGRNNYADIVAETYAQNAQDKEFWESLSSEEKKKMETMLDKRREASNIKDEGASTTPVKEEPAVRAKPAASTETNTENLDMFSDYADDA